MEIEINNVQIHTLNINGEVYYSCNHVYKLLGICWKGRNDLLARLGKDTVLIKANIPTTKRQQFVWFMTYRDFLRLLVHHGNNDYSIHVKETMILEYMKSK